MFVEYYFTNEKERKCCLVKGNAKKEDMIQAFIDNRLEDDVLWRMLSGNIVKKMVLILNNLNL